jgi:adenylate cyclase
VNDRQRLAGRFTRRLALSMVTANVVGALVVFVYLVFIVPRRPDDTAATVRLNAIVASSYLLVALVLGTVGSVLLQLRLLRWLRPGHQIGTADRQVTMRLPARLVRLYGALWAVAVVLFAALNAPRSLDTAVDVAVTIAAGGATTCALSYLLAERVLRPRRRRGDARTERPAAGGARRAAAGAALVGARHRHPAARRRPGRRPAR